MVQGLHAYLRSLDWQDGGDGRAPIASLYARFKEIAARPEVSDVYVGLHWEWNDPDYADTFPPAETVFIVTSAPRAQVDSWLTGLQADGAREGWPHGKPSNAPEPATGHRVYRVCWD